MKFGPAQDVRKLVSLINEPCRYPDTRAWAERGAFAQAGGRFWELRGPLDEAVLDDWLLERSAVGLAERTALLAVGSNAYPRQLFDKFQGRAGAEEGIITAPAWVDGYGVAFCPVLSRKGYVPVTLSRRPGRTERTWLQWLTAGQLEQVRTTEGPRYALVGGPQLAAALAPPLPFSRPAAVYAWWFDSVLYEAGAPAWVEAEDDFAQRRLLVRLAAASGAAGWNGCRLPPQFRAPINERLRCAARPNKIPPM